METFELDLENQSQETLKGFKAATREKEREEKTPGCCGLLWMLIKFFWWVFFRVPWMVVGWACGQRRKNKKAAKEAKLALPVPVTSS